MDEYVRRMYLKEEEFLEEYLGTVEAAVDLLHLDWQPNYSCNDHARDHREETAASTRRHHVAACASVQRWAHRQAASALARLRASAKRRSGSFSRQRSTTASRSSGQSGRSACTGRTG